MTAIVGISAFYHESAACLVQDGRLVAAAAEERFTRVKHDARLPVNAYRFCLASADLTPADVDVVAYYELPELKRERQLWSGVPDSMRAEIDDPGRPERWIRELLGYEGEVLFFPHHLSHAASAYYFSGFDDAAVLTVDGVGEWATTTYGRGHGSELEAFDEVRFPHSLGLFYATITSFLGFRVNDGEYKVMGLAPYGRPRFADEMRRLLRSEPGPGFVLDLAFFDFMSGPRMFSARLGELLGVPPRQPGEELTEDHADLARSAQLVLEEVLLDKVAWLAGRVDVPDLCLAGGVALNCVANGRIRREGPFERLFVQPAAGDAGGSLGAAALAHVRLTGERPGVGPMTRVDVGPAFSPAQIAAAVAGAGIAHTDYTGRGDDLVEAVAARLAAGEVVGWFDGAMEFGPRALGQRSILADPRHPGMRDRLNHLVKRRESFRPFAPTVPAGHAADHFDLDHASPFMLETCQVTSPLDLPAITHVDGSARPQTVEGTEHPRYAALLAAFARRTGCPVLLNTSLNTAGEPIVRSPAEALRCLARAGLDALVLGDVIVEGAALPADLAGVLAQWDDRPRRGFGDDAPSLRSDLYTFV